jgi:hypothetical protein
MATIRGEAPDGDGFPDSPTRTGPIRSGMSAPGNLAVSACTGFEAPVLKRPGEVAERHEAVAQPGG